MPGGRSEVAERPSTRHTSRSSTTAHEGCHLTTMKSLHWCPLWKKVVYSVRLGNAWERGREEQGNVSVKFGPARSGDKISPTRRAFLLPNVTAQSSNSKKCVSCRSDKHSYRAPISRCTGRTLWSRKAGTVLPVVPSKNEKVGLSSLLQRSVQQRRRHSVRCSSICAAALPSRSSRKRRPTQSVRSREPRKRGT